MDRLEEALQICRAMFTEDAPSFDGRYYRIHEARNIPRPVQSGGPPILIGGGGEKRTLRLVARYADMMNIFGVCRDGGTQGGRPAPPLRGRWAATPPRSPVSRLSTLVLTASAGGDGCNPVPSSVRSPARQPTTSDIGTPDELVARVEELAAAGVQYFIFNMPTGSPDTVRQVGELLINRFGD